MKTKNGLNFISDAKLLELVDKLLSVMEKSEQEIDNKIFDNGVDAFTAIFDALGRETSLSQWLEQERSIKKQKTLQNHIGTFHQSVLGSVKGWEDLGTGSVVDIRSNKRKIFAEIKNKHNTTKGNHKIAIYDDFKSLQNEEEYKGFTGYYVEIIPKNRKKYNIEFTPSDNRTSTKRSTDQKIRKIDGYSFYEMVTKEKDALFQLYKYLPIIIGMIIKTSHSYVTEDPLFEKLFFKAYQQE